MVLSYVDALEFSRKTLVSYLTNKLWNESDKCSVSEFREKYVVVKETIIMLEAEIKEQLKNESL